MGWQISNISNDVKLTKKQALELSKNDYYYQIVSGHYSRDRYVDDNEMLEYLFIKDGKHYKLLFLSDHMEHMDYICDILTDLTSLKLKGDITFGSLDGDNRNSYWGYRFDGQGNMKTLTGSISFVED